MSRGPHIFAQLTAKCPYTLEWAALCPSEVLLPTGDVDSHLIHGSLGLPNSNGIWIGSAVFAGLITVTDRQTDRPCYSVGNNRPPLRT